MRVLNLYAGIGGNRRLWPKGVKVTSVENDSKIAGVYKKIYPKDKVVVEDAHQYLLDHYKKFDFIWSSPPCQSHSIVNRFLNKQGYARYPDMKLYEEIIFLKHFFKRIWVVENVKGYYDPLEKPYLSGRHYFWSNKIITNKNIKTSSDILSLKVSELEKFHGLNLSGYNIDKTKVLRNAVHPKLGLHVFNCVVKNIQKRLFEKVEVFGDGF